MVLVALVTVAVFRGIDYVLGATLWDDGTLMGEMAPRWVWGVGFLVAGVTLALGAVQRRHLVVYVGHGLLALIYALNGSAVYLTSGIGTVEGVRPGAALMFIALINAIAALRTGARPLSAPGPHYPQQMPFPVAPDGEEE